MCSGSSEEKLFVVVEKPAISYLHCVKCITNNSESDTVDSLHDHQALECVNAMTLCCRTFSDTHHNGSSVL